MPPIRQHSTFVDDDDIYGEPSNSSDSQNNSQNSFQNVRSQGNGGISWIWKHGTEIAGKRWRCDLCIPHTFAKTFSKASTTHAAEHLRKAHNLAESNEPAKDQKTINSPRTFIDPTVLRRLVAEWTVDRHHAFID